MRLVQIIKSLKANGYILVARGLQDEYIKQLKDGHDVRQMYSDVIMDYMYDVGVQPTPEEVIISPEFAMLRSVAQILATYTPAYDVAIDLMDEDLVLEQQVLLALKNEAPTKVV